MRAGKHAIVVGEEGLEAFLGGLLAMISPGPEEPLFRQDQ
jgi:hypothetical protein